MNYGLCKLQPYPACGSCTHTGFIRRHFRFRKFGPLRYARITVDAATGRSRGTGFVCFWNRVDADSVVEQSELIRADMTGGAEATLVRSSRSRLIAV